MFLDSVSPDASEAVRIVPSAGKAVIFEHNLFHSSAPLDWGTKYVMRTDVLFSKNAKDASIFATDTEDEEQQVRSISGLCTELKLSQDDREVLDALGMHEISIDSFLSPGITALKMMLRDFMSSDTINRVIGEAVRRAKENS